MTIKSIQSIQSPIFISYTRKDRDAVMPFVSYLEEELGTDCWIDLDGVETGDQFEDVIIRAIDSSKIVLFMLSENSLSSAWTKREVYYAESEKKKIVPVVIDDKGYRGWFKFHFGNLDYIDIASKEQRTKLLRNIRDWLGIEHQAIIEQSTKTMKRDRKWSSLSYLMPLIAVSIIAVGIGIWSYFSSDETVSKASGIVEGHEYVDLQLPSGLKWARCNIGAEEPEGFGYYYAWGETEQKPNYTWYTYKFSIGDSLLTKYNFSNEEGLVDSIFILQDIDDVARSAWGGGWRMPNSIEYRELIDNCDYSWEKVNGVWGGLLKSRKNGNTIFFPAAGSRISSGKWGEKEVECWTVDIGAYNPWLANHVTMDSLSADVDNTIRDLGRPIRAVFK